MLLAAACASPAADDRRERIAPVVDDVIRAVMAEHDIPGMAVALAIDGEPFVFTYGVASKADARPVTERTLFEIGSITKMFTATLACEAAVSGALSLDDAVSSHVPELVGSAFDAVSVRDLGTYTAGGLPLQFPDDVTDPIAWFAGWRPEHAPGTHRRYSNPSIALLGEVAARSLGTPFEVLVQQRLLPRLGLRETYLQVPAERLADYADGHRSDGTVTRLSPGPMSAPTYGIRTTAGDLLRFVQANIDPSSLDEALQQGVAATHIGCYWLGGMLQGVGWEMYADPNDLDTLLVGNSAQVLFAANPVGRLPVPSPGRPGMLYGKTGSTNGFGAYVAFVPERRLGVVLLANKSYPIAARVASAHRILTALDG